MNTNTVSGCHTLRIIPLIRLMRFARIGSRAHILYLGTPDEAKEVPGSLKVSNTTENVIIKNKLTFNRKNVTAAGTDQLNGYKSAMIIATYIDENGNQRVAGSPSYPLNLDFTITDGVFACVLEGEDTQPDAFL